MVEKNFRITSSPSSVKIGTRKTHLAMAQAQLVADKLQTIGVRSVILTFSTLGDSIQNCPIRDIPARNVFTKELDEALLDGRIDIAVHCLKDIPSRLPDNIIIGAYLKRSSPYDAWISATHTPLQQAPAGTRVGTSSLRRRMQILAQFPHLNVYDVRGSILSRLQKMKNGQFDGLILAHTSFLRLGLSHFVTQILPPRTALPAVGQGTLVLTCHEQSSVLPIIQHFNDAMTVACAQMERGFLHALDGACNLPIAAYARPCHVAPNRIFFRSMFGHIAQNTLSFQKKWYTIGPKSTFLFGKQQGLILKKELNV